MLLVTALGLSLCAQGTEPPRWVFAVGANEGLREERPLAYAERDAAQFMGLLHELGGADFDNSWLLEGPTAQELRSALDEMVAQAELQSAPPIVFWYFSGHADEEAMHLGDARLPFQEVEETLAAAPFDLRLMVVDACRGERGRDKGLVPAEGFGIEVQSGLKGLVSVRSASPGELSQESDQLEAGVFTHQLLTGMRGAADRDLDQQVSFDEAYRYAFNQTVRYSAVHSGRVMHPSVQLDVEGTGRLIMTDLRSAGAALILPEGRDERYLVFARPVGDLVSEVWTQRSSQTQVRLPKGRYLIVRQWGPRSEAAELLLDGDQELSGSGFVRVPASAVAAKGGRLRLSVYELTGSYAPARSTEGALAHQARLRFGWRRNKNRWSASLDLGQTDFELGPTQQRERWLGGDLRYGRRLIWWLSVTGGVAWRVVRQNIERDDAGQLEGSGLEPAAGSTALAAGPSLGLDLRLPLWENLDLHLETRGTLFFREEDGQIALRPEIGPELGLSFAF